MQDLYNTNKDFKAYVDRYRNNSHEGKGCRLEEAMEHELVREYGEMCREREEIKNEIKRD